MSVYTTQLRYPIENYLARQGIEWSNMSVRERCVKGIPYVFDFAFPIWDEGDRQRFQTDFLMLYYQQEIGSETWGLWKCQLENWLNINMPYYNRKMKLVMETGELDKLISIGDTWEEKFTGSGESSGNSHVQTEGSNGSMQKYYEVPSSNITSIENHLNNATQLEAQGRNETTGEDANNNSSEHTIIRTSKRDLNRITVLEKMLDLTKNVEKEILEAMDVLFMGIY